MPNRRVLVTSKGCYAVNEDGVTVELEAGQEALIEDVQAAVFVKVRKAEFITNKKKAAKKTTDSDKDEDEDTQDNESDDLLNEINVKAD
jgi:hypothetical protein